MSLTGGKRKVNKSLKAWVTFVKKVQKEENISSYKDAIHRAKVRKDKGEKWMKMKGGEGEEEQTGELEDLETEYNTVPPRGTEQNTVPDLGTTMGGRRRTKRSSRRFSRRRGRTVRRSKRRASRRH